MSRFRSLGLSAILLTSVLVFGCNGKKAGVVTPTSPAIGAQDIRARENSHHVFAQQTSDVQSMRQETARYGADMRGMMDSMMATCKSMGSMGTGMMGGHSTEDMQRMMDRMRLSVSSHESRMTGLGDMMAMRSECAAHHDQMTGMLSEMDQMMSGNRDSHHGQ